MLEVLPIIPSSTSQKFTHYSFLFIITYYSNFILFRPLLFQVLTSREKDALET